MVRLANQYVIFELADEFYGVDIHQVRGIEKPMSLTRVPNAPEFVQGVCNLRGSVIPVIDLRRRLGLSAGTETKNTRVLIVNVDKYTVGMVIDNANDVVNINPDMIEPSPALVSGIDSEFIRGVAKINNRLLVLLDLNKILSVQEISDLEQIN
ncbi:MAG: chemotaxis protein CheW [Firmicutes bacterium]|nr:chemotaxis protein CheW [Bacillota bacterium]